jgi:protein ImuA
MGTRQVITELAQQIRSIERSQRHAATRRDFTPPGLPGLERLLGDEGWPRGCLVEWLAEGCGTGSASLALWASRAAWRDNLLVMIDSQRELHAPAALPFDVDLDRTVFIRPERSPDALWSLEQVLRTRGIGAAVCDVERLSSAECRRLQLAAETGGGLGILLRPAQARRQPSFAEYRFLVQPLPPPANTNAAVARRWRVELLRARRQFAQSAVIVELSHDSDGLCLASELAAATPAA